MHAFAFVTTEPAKHIVRPGSFKRNECFLAIETLPQPAILTGVALAKNLADFFLTIESSLQVDPLQFGLQVLNLVSSGSNDMCWELTVCEGILALLPPIETA